MYFIFRLVHFHFVNLLYTGVLDQGETFQKIFETVKLIKNYFTNFACILKYFTTKTQIFRNQFNVRENIFEEKIHRGLFL